jgi:hypothetical protein
MVSVLLYIFITAITCFMAYMIEKERPAAVKLALIDGYRSRESFRNRLYMAGIFLILFALSALRYGIGNDYAQYIQTAHEAYVGGYVVTEAGFNWLVKLIYTISGGEYYELFFAVFAAATLFFFLKAFARQSVNFYDTFFLFMTLGLYFQTFNTVRYYLALGMALYSMKYVLEKDYIRFVFVICIAALFHKSVLLVIPVYILCTYEWKIRHILAGVVLSAGCFAANGFILKLALKLYPSYKNTIYLEGGTSLTSILRTLAVLGLYAWFMIYSGSRIRNKSWYRELRFYGQLNLLAFVAGTFFSFLPVVTRIAYYFGVSQLFMIPLILKNIDDKKLQTKVRSIVYIACVIYFVVFLLQAHQAGVGLLPYKSWIFESDRYIYK